MTKTIGGDIFKDGPSPELEANWDELETMINAFRNTSSLKEKRIIASCYPEIMDEVVCESCKQILDSGECL